MKAYRLLTTVLFVFASLITVLIGCSYDAAQPPWPQAPGNTSEVTITGINPAQALGGVNTITILGSNMLGAIDSNRVTIKYNDTLIVSDTTYKYNGVFFDNVQATVIEANSTMIKVLRPNVVSDNCLIKIASDKALTVANFGPYKISAVMEPYASFVANVPLSTITADNAGNLYVVETTSRYLWKIAPNGQKTQIMTRDGGDTAFVLAQVPTDAKISPDGKLFYFQFTFPRTKDIHMIDLNSPVKKDSLWYTFNPTKNVLFGDFAPNGYFYTGGRRSGIMIVRPDRSIRADGYYPLDTISSMRVFNGFVYVAISSGIWRHSISDTGKVGAPELVIDFTQGILQSLPLRAFSFSADGSKLYIGTDSQYPVLVADATSLPIPPGKVEVMYKGILPSNCKQFCFGNYLYTIIGNTSPGPAVNWTVYKIDVGTTGSPYY
jgi:hypothetical protein